MDDTTERLKYPIGRFQKPDSINAGHLTAWIKQIEDLPPKLRSEVEELSADQLNTPYRSGGWTLRQVIHHLPDSHMNAYIRSKLALTEDSPVIRPYYEDRWAELPEAKTGDIEVSLNLLKNLHQRWVLFLRSLSKEDLNKIYIHPEHTKSFILKEVIGMYAWHGEHHLAHIKTAKERNNW